MSNWRSENLIYTCGYYPRTNKRIWNVGTYARKINAYYFKKFLGEDLKLTEKLKIQNSLNEKKKIFIHYILFVFVKEYFIKK